MRGIVVFSLALGMVLGADDPHATAKKKEAERQELEKVSGVWVQVGDKVPPENVAAKLIYTGRTFEGRLGDKVLFKGHVRLDPTKSPKEVDLTLETGPNQGKTLLGVYELDPENYRGCLAAPGKPRPAKLTPDQGSGQLAFSFRRVARSPDFVEAVAAELKRFEGHWYYASAIVGGKPAPEETLKASRLVLAGNEFTLTRPELAQRGSYSVDPTVTPKVVDVTFSDGPRAGKSIKGIYELSGDTCKICMAAEDEPRPTEFASTSGSGLTLEVLRRLRP